MDIEKIEIFTGDDFKKIYKAFKDGGGKLDGVTLGAITQIPFKPLSDYLSKLEDYGIVELERRDPYSVPDHYWHMNEKAVKNNVRNCLGELKENLYSEFDID